MTDTAKIDAGVTGRCLCGAVSYRLSKAQDHFDACHCTMCRRWSGGIHLGYAAGPDDVVWTGADNISRYASSDWAERAFCATCGGHLYYRVTAEGPAKGHYAMAAGSLDDLEGLTLSKEIYIDAKPQGVALAGDHPRLTEAEFLHSIGQGPAPK